LRLAKGKQPVFMIQTQPDFGIGAQDLVPAMIVVDQSGMVSELFQTLVQMLAQVIADGDL